MTPTPRWDAAIERRVRRALVRGTPRPPSTRRSQATSPAGDQEQVPALLLRPLETRSAAPRHAARDPRQPGAPPWPAGYYAEGAFDPEQTRAALAKLTAPVLILAAEFDLSPTPERAAEAASLFLSGEIALQPASAHMPSVDNPVWFTTTLADFLNRR